MRVARLEVHSSRGAGAGKGGRPWTDWLSERGADGATRGSGVRHFLLWMGVVDDGDGRGRAEQREDRDPRRATAQGDKAVPGRST